MSYRPQFIRLIEEKDEDCYRDLINEHKPLVCDTIRSQIRELVLCQNPKLGKSDPEIDRLIDKKLEVVSGETNKYGVWVYYPWKNTLVHILDEEEFIEVRTNRNKYKITQEEQDILRSKKIGIAGLSVGRAVALTIALERIAGEIRLADFDTIELSNLNRISAPISEIGLNKSIGAAREIAEIDPFIKVVCYTEGLSESNILNFLTSRGNLDVFVEECDTLHMKFFSRLKCKELKIPVVMETNDNCILDIERFDLEPNRDIFHGRFGAFKSLEQFNFDEANRPLLISKMFEINSASDSMKKSINEVGKTIRGLPQLGSEVYKGSGILAAVVSRILLGYKMGSCRRYFESFK